MEATLRRTFWSLSFALAFAAGVPAPHAQAPAGFVSLFNGRNLSGWIVPEGDNGHWKVVDGAIDYDARSEAPKDKNLWSEKEYKDFILRVDWRIKAAPFRNKDARIVLPDGTEKKDENGQTIRIDVPDADSGIFLRGSGRAQVNIWCWPVGSGEFYGYRTDAKMPPEVRAAVTPRVNADKNIGEWNAFEITVEGDTVSVVLNGKRVIEGARLPGLPERGRLALQHHGSFREGRWMGPPSLVQFRNIYIKEL
jgi:hypothetical protein